MGTRRSKHNKGRKPLYKHFERDTIRQWTFGEEPTERNWDDREPQRIVYSTAKPTPSPELLPIVQKYIEARKIVEARKEANSHFPAVGGNVLALVEDGARNPHLVAERVEPSERDVLLQLFVEHRISAGQLHAGRRWQAWREAAAIQPNATIDWSGEYKPYQARGNLTELQFAAMRARRQFLDYAGIASVTFLDFCLDADRGCADLMRLLRLDRRQIGDVLDDLLMKLCAFYGKRRDEGLRVDFWRAA